MNNRAERRRQEREAKEIRKTLISGDGIFWDLKSDVIHLKSEEEVAQHFGVKLSGRYVEVPLDLFLSLNQKQKMHILQLVGEGKTEEEVLQELKRLLADTPLTIR
ncbi:hypothetical protein ES705_29253 [subsurface metagenome]|jgi:hypothetical protein